MIITTAIKTLVFLWGRTQSTAKNEVCVLLWYRILAEKAKSFCGFCFFFLDKFFLGLGGIEIGERGRDFRVLFLWSEFDPSAVDRAVKERKGRERGRERNIIKEIFFF